MAAALRSEEVEGQPRYGACRFRPSRPALTVIGRENRTNRMGMTMDSAALQKYLLRLFERHDVQLDADEDGWLTTDGDFPTVRAQWHEGAAGAPGHLDIDVVLSEDRGIEESFAGHGAGTDGCMAALRAFEQSAFHPLLAACWYVTDDRKLTITSWE